MDEIAQVLAAKNREAMGLWLLVLNRLGISNKEAAERFGVSPALVSYWATGQRRMTLEDEAMAYGLFADTFLEKWPKAGAKKREKLLPLVQRLVQTWEEAATLRKEDAERELDALLDQCSPIHRQQVRTPEEWYKFATGAQHMEELARAISGHEMARKAWKHAAQVLADAKQAEGEPKGQRPRRKGQRSRV